MTITVCCIVCHKFALVDDAEDYDSAVTYLVENCAWTYDHKRDVLYCSRCGSERTNNANNSVPNGS